jgi:transposase
VAKKGRKPELFTLDNKQRQELCKRYQRTPEHKIAQRLLALLWLDEGKVVDEVAALLQVAPKTVRRWRKLYLRKGLEELCVLHYKGAPGKLKPAQVAQLKEAVKTGRFHCARQVQDWLHDTFGVVLSISAVKKLLQRIGCSYHKTSGFLFKADRVKQAAFLDKYDQQKRQQGPDTRRYFVDGVHLVWGLEMLYCCWLLRGQRLHVGMGGGRKRWNILGAYCPQDQEYLDRRYADKNLNAQSVIELMQLMHARHPLIKRFILYLDNARYQHARLAKEWIAAYQQETGVTFVLEHLPAYSPNLNLIERLWKFLRKKALQKWYKTFAEMQAGVAAVLDNLPQYAAELRTLLTEKFRLAPEMNEVLLHA